LPRLPDTAVVDILLRRRAPHPQRDCAPPCTDTTADITAAVVQLDSSYLAVHGPPGTGKTYTAAQVIKSLIVDHGWRIGVVAQSHATVENLLGRVIDADWIHNGSRERCATTLRAGRRSTGANTPRSLPTTRAA